MTWFVSLPKGIQISKCTDLQMYIMYLNIENVVLF